MSRLEQDLRSLALDDAFGRVGDDDYLRRKTTLTAEIDETRQPRPSPGSVDPARALAWLEDLRSLWEVELPEAPEHGATRAAPTHACDGLAPVSPRARGSVSVAGRPVAVHLALVCRLSIGTARSSPSSEPGERADQGRGDDDRTAGMDPRAAAAGA